MAKENSGNPRDVKLKDGRTITVSLDGVTWKEVMAASKASRTSEDYSVLIAKGSGLSVEELECLPYNEARQVETAVWKLVNSPVDTDPN